VIANGTTRVDDHQLVCSTDERQPRRPGQVVVLMLER
jgi:hypothetical protein